MKKSMLTLTEKKRNIGFPTFKLTASTETLFKTDPLNIIFEISVYDYLAM